MAEAERVSTSPSVSTVIDRQFVENLPISGRSFQSLLQLTPGVTLFAGQHESAGRRPVQRQRPADQRELLHGGRRERQCEHDDRHGQLLGPLGLGLAAGPVGAWARRRASCRSTRCRSSGCRPRPTRRSSGGCRAAQIQMVTRAGTNKFTGLGRLVLSATTRWTRSTSSPSSTTCRKPKLAQNNFSARARRSDHPQQDVLLLLVRGAAPRSAADVDRRRADGGAQGHGDAGHPRAAQYVPACRTGPC